MPLAHYETVRQVAEERGIDLAAMLNEIIAEAVPGLQNWLASRQLLRAARSMLVGSAELERESPEQFALMRALVEEAEAAPPDDRVLALYRAAHARLPGLAEGDPVSGRILKVASDQLFWREVVRQREREESNAGQQNEEQGAARPG